MVEGTEIKEKIIRDGYCYVQNSSYESFKKTTSFLGKEIMKTPVMVRQQKSKGSLVTSSKSLSLQPIITTQNSLLGFVITTTRKVAFQYYQIVRSF